MKTVNESVRTSSPVAWTAAGSDPGGGAGLQADLRVFGAFGVHGCSIVTALTVQNTLGVQSVHPVDEAILRAQFWALEEDLPPAAVKSGMLGSAAACRVLAERLDALEGVPYVCDPVLVSSSGAPLLDPEGITWIRERLLPRADLLTPNLPEAEALIGRPFFRPEEAADALLAMGARSVLLKGGHASGDCCRDYWTNGKESFFLESPRIDTRATHGTGCILSAAVAALLARGTSLSEAIVGGKTYINQALRSPAEVGQGRGPMRLEPFRDDPVDRPRIVRC